jgi:hypothetical protein
MREHLRPWQATHRGRRGSGRLGGVPLGAANVGRSRVRLVIDFLGMAPLACLMHWYISMLYVVPVLAVGGWGWWSTKRMSKRKTPPGSTGSASSA